GGGGGRGRSRDIPPQIARGGAGPVGGRGAALSGRGGGGRAPARLCPLCLVVETAKALLMQRASRRPPGAVGAGLAPARLTCSWPGCSSSEFCSAVLHLPRKHLLARGAPLARPSSPSPTPPP